MPKTIIAAAIDNPIPIFPSNNPITAPVTAANPFSLIAPAIPVKAAVNTCVPYARLL